MRPLLFLSGVLVGAGGLLLALRRVDVVEVTGSSMLPALRPGDRLLVESLTYASRAPRPGEVVLAHDPRMPARELIKRVAGVDEAAGRVELRGDAADASTDSRTFGAVPLHDVRWRVVARYWPVGKPGRPA